MQSVQTSGLKIIVRIVPCAKPASVDKLCVFACNQSIVSVLSLSLSLSLSSAHSQILLFASPLTQ